MNTLEELNEDCPQHDRTSCSDEYPINAGVDLRHGHTWCRRCEGLSKINHMRKPLSYDELFACDELMTLKAKNKLVMDDIVDIVRVIERLHKIS